MQNQKSKSTCFGSWKGNHFKFSYNKRKVVSSLFDKRILSNAQSAISFPYQSKEIKPVCVWNLSPVQVKVQIGQLHILWVAFSMCLKHKIQKQSQLQ